MTPITDFMGTAAELYREEGITGVAGGAVRSLRRSLPFLDSPPHQANRIDIDERWGLIRSRLTPDDRTLLDIGCNAGMLTARAAETGLFSVGVEVNESNLRYGGHDFEPGLGLMQYEISPDTVEEIPAFDVVLLLSIFHQWGRTYGWEAAEGMLAALDAKADTVFVEISPYQTPPENLSHPRDGTDAVTYYREFLESVFPEGASVEFLDETTTTAAANRESGENRLLYVIETSASSASDS